jgi:hypothetical protein
MKKFFMDTENLVLFILGDFVLGALLHKNVEGVMAAGKYIMTHPNNAMFAIIFAAVAAIIYSKVKKGGNNGFRPTYNQNNQPPRS